MKSIGLSLLLGLAVLLSGCGGGVAVSWDQYGTNVGAASSVNSYQWDPQGYRSTR